MNFVYVCIILWWWIFYTQVLTPGYSLYQFSFWRSSFFTSIAFSDWAVPQWKERRLRSPLSDSIFCPAFLPTWEWQSGIMWNTNIVPALAHGVEVDISWYIKSTFNKDHSSPSSHWSRVRLAPCIKSFSAGQIFGGVRGIILTINMDNDAHCGNRLVPVSSAQSKPIQVTFQSYQPRSPPLQWLLTHHPATGA